MAERRDEDVYGITSPGGFVFGVQGWHWGNPRPVSITFFLDNTAVVGDQYGRPIRGTVHPNGKELYFALGPPQNDDKPSERASLATHEQVIDALEAERVKWQDLKWAGWPQIPYERLKALPELPPTPLEELRKIKDNRLRKDALRARREADESRAREMQAIEEE